MARAILGVIVGYVAGAVFVIGLFVVLWFALGPDAMLEQGRYQGTMAVGIADPIVALVGGLVAGLVCAQIARSHKALLVLAAIMLIIGAFDGFHTQSRPDSGPRPEGISPFEAMGHIKPPMWLSIVNPLIGAVGALMGGCGACCTKKP